MSYRKIISVVNEHTASTLSSRYAVSLAEACKAELVLYAAHDSGSNESLLLRTERHQELLYKIASDLGITVRRIIEVGTVRTLLPRMVLAENADLVLYPLMPLERYGSNVQQHTVHHLLRVIKSNLAIMRTVTMAKPHPGSILVPFGNVISDKCHRLLFVSELARSFNSHVTLFHLFAESETKGTPDDITWFREQLQLQNITVLERSGRGTLQKAITIEAITGHNDLIVLGASERSIFRKLFFGNPAGDVMHKPPCNIILFRPAV